MPATMVVTLRREAKELGINTMDFAKRLLDYGFHAPTTYFPLLVPECLLIEPTESETQEELDGFVAALIKIRAEAREQPDLVRSAPTGCRCAACTRYEPPSAWIWRGPTAMANGNTTLPAGVVLSGPAAFPCRVTSVRDIN